MRKIKNKLRLITLMLFAPLLLLGAEQYELRVTTQTGDEPNSKTDNVSVFIKINGSEEMKFQLDDKNRNGFEHDALDDFKGMYFSIKPSEIEYFELEVGSGDDAWLLRTITFQVFSDSVKNGSFR